MISPRDPAAISPTERLDEVAELLAKAYLRLSESRRKALEDCSPPEALCGAVNGPETPRKERA